MFRNFTVIVSGQEIPEAAAHMRPPPCLPPLLSFTICQPTWELLFSGSCEPLGPGPTLHHFLRTVKAVIGPSPTQSLQREIYMLHFCSHQAFWVKEKKGHRNCFWWAVQLQLLEMKKSATRFYSTNQHKLVYRQQDGAWSYWNEWGDSLGSYFNMDWD